MIETAPTFNSTIILGDFSFTLPSDFTGKGTVQISNQGTEVHELNLMKLAPGVTEAQAKAALLALMRQYALDYGADGIRANAVNADRIRSGLLTETFINERAKARGVSEKEYMSGNLLRREVTADDVAQAFLHQALALKTTADVTTVDGGNIAAAMR